MHCTSWSIEEDRGVHAIDPQPTFASHKTRFIAARRGDGNPPREARDGAVDARPAAVQADGPVVCRSEAIGRVLAEVRQVAPTAATVLLIGETGVGKEVVAQANGWRPARPAPARAAHPAGQAGLVR